MLLLAHEDIGVYQNWDGGYEGFGVATIKDQLAAMPLNDPTLIIGINSFGGMAHEGIGLYNFLRNFAASRRILQPEFKIQTRVDGIAYSAASILFCAGDERIMGTGTKLMIHDAWTFAAGNARDLEKTIEKLKTWDGQIATIYTKVGTEKQDNFATLMSNETYMGFEQAKKLGLATAEFSDPSTAKNAATNNSILAPVLSRGDYSKFLNDRYTAVCKERKPAQPKQETKTAQDERMRKLRQIEMTILDDLSDK